MPSCPPAMFAAASAASAGSAGSAGSARPLRHGASGAGLAVGGAVGLADEPHDGAAAELALAQRHASLGLASARRRIAPAPHDPAAPRPPRGLRAVVGGGEPGTDPP